MSKASMVVRAVSRNDAKEQSGKDVPLRLCSFCISFRDTSYLTDKIKRSVMITYRIMKLDDIAAGLAICRSAGWNQLARDWKIFLDLSENGCRVAMSEERIIGTVATIRYQHAFSWIGMVLVDPAWQRQGIGIRLLEEALAILHDEETIKLDATPAGRELYIKLDFQEEYRLSRMTTIVDEEKLEVSTACVLDKNDLHAVAAFDREIFGADREPLLKRMLEGSPEFAFLVKEKNDIRGYCMGRHGYNFTHIGPVIAAYADVAKQLVSAAMKNCTGRPVIIDVTHFDKEWLNWLTVAGFTEQRPFIRMYRGSNKFPGLPEKQFAILGPEFG